MVEHIVLVNLTNKDAMNKKQDLIEKVRAFKEHIPGVLDSQAGDNFSKGLDFGITVRFENKKALDDYVPHPRHQEVILLLKEMGMSDLTVLDFEI
ncbi:MAG TPA: Dabb family protein [Chondromyces sp.]|nr:Dabb family protein [Chondromyces sp.]